MAQKAEEKDTKKQTEDSKADGSTCPECDEPVDNLRKTCRNCGYEYKEEDYDDLEAGNELIAGTNMDDDGNEITDEGPGAE